MPRKRTSRLRARKQGGATRYDGDFRDYTVVGGGIEALKPAGSKWATTDPTSDSVPQRVFRSLDCITTREVHRFIARLREKDGKGGSKVSASSVREYSNSLSNLFRRAESEGCVPPEPTSHRRTWTGRSISPAAAADG